MKVFIAVKRKLIELYYLMVKIRVKSKFDNKYLTGRWFDGELAGWFWGLDYIRALKRKEVKEWPWPISKYITIQGKPEDIIFDIDDLNDFQGKGNYFQCAGGKIFIGKGTYIANNVGLITANHDPLDLDKHLPGKDIVLGKECWIGMNAMILPGVTLGDHTVVGAGAVVTHSFPDGYCVIAGNPAKEIRKLSIQEQEFNEKQL